MPQTSTRSGARPIVLLFGAVAIIALIGTVITHGKVDWFGNDRAAVPSPNASCATTPAPVAPAFPAPTVDRRVLLTVSAQGCPRDIVISVTDSRHGRLAPEVLRAPGHWNLPFTIPANGWVRLSASQDGSGKLECAISSLHLSGGYGSIDLDDRETAGRVDCTTVGKHIPTG